MRLLHTFSYELHEFIGSKIPEYAILSHTWEEEEVLFSDLRDSSSRDTSRHKKGWQKILGACKRAREDGLEWVWIDTCCINKESSAELSEAINSMFKYYRDAFVCYAYLSDYQVQKNGYPDQGRGIPVFGKCRWFTRGWTLQELIAPSDLVFFDADWNDMGTRWGLMGMISRVTSIPTIVLRHGDIKDISIAARMSWAADRQTSREEDRAYSLMGIFGVNIPPLYGEGGDRAFMRLQEEIIKYSNDQSIFAWSASFSNVPQSSGLLARSPSVFKASTNVRVSGVANNTFPYSLTNRGLRIHLPMEPDCNVFSGKERNDLFIAYLDCEIQDTNERLGIYLRKRTDSTNMYERWFPDRLLKLPSARTSPRYDRITTEIYVANMENLTRSEFGSKRRVFSHVDFLSTTKKITKDNLSDAESPSCNLSQMPCNHYRHTIRTYDMCYHLSLTERPIHVNFVLIYNDHDLLCAATIKLGRGLFDRATAHDIVRKLILNPRDQLIIPLDSENESLMVSIRKRVQNPKKNDSDADRYCCLLKAVPIPSSWASGPRENPWRLKEDELMGGSITPNEKRPIVLSMEVVRPDIVDFIRTVKVFSANTPNPPGWHFNTDFLISRDDRYDYEMMIPDETKPYVLHVIFNILTANSLFHLDPSYYSISSITGSEHSY
jgi:hypothetical protein